MSVYGLAAAAGPPSTRPGAGTVAPPSSAPGIPDQRVLTGMAGAVPPVEPAVVAPAPMTVEKARELNELIKKQPKTKEDKDKILSAVKDRMKSRAQELRDEVALTGSADAKKKLAALETLIRRVDGRTYRYGGFWSTDKRFAYVSGDGVQLCDRFFDVPLTPQAGDEITYMDVWLGERAAVLGHEEVHIDQAYWFNWGERGETEAWTATGEWLDVFNKEKIESVDTRNKGYADKSGGAYVPFDPEVQKETRTRLGKDPPTP